jgi:ATP-dependent Clp protease ATP-binding subunit ClpC
MFERFTERSRQVIVLAQQEARIEGCSHIQIRHLILGLLGEEDGLAARVLATRCSALDYRQPATGKTLTHQQIPFEDNAKKALELALREALSLGHNYIGTEHILLGIIRQEPTAIPGGAEAVRNDILRVLAGPTKKEKPDFTMPEREKTDPTPTQVVEGVVGNLRKAADILDNWGPAVVNIVQAIAKDIKKAG